VGYPGTVVGFPESKLPCSLTPYELGANDNPDQNACNEASQLEGQLFFLDCLSAERVSYKPPFQKSTLMLCHSSYMLFVQL